MKDLRILEIQISDLFGELSYDIQLPAENPIAIITAPNGRGKTTILNLVSLMFDPSFPVFNTVRTVPFDRFRCILSNGKMVELKKTELEADEKNSRSRRASALREQSMGAIHSYFESGDFGFSIFNGKKQSTPIVFSHALSDALSMEPQEFIDDDYEFIYRNRAQRYLESRFTFIRKQIINALSENECDIRVNYIKADRIQPVARPGLRPRDYDELRQISPLEDARKKIGELITNKTDEYYNAVSLAKDKLPKMFLENEGGSLEADEFIAGWKDYRQELTQFQDIGLITPTEDFTYGKDIPKVYKDKGPFLSTYLQAFKDTTEPLRQIYERLNLFKTILDERNAITGKKVFFGRDGVKLAVGDREIKLDTLSSGEKHDFIMFYNLILGSAANGLVLIDEPEISLHIEWQDSYLDKLISICEMNGLQAIIATHSPNIVSSHYDFLVDKGET